jgi:UvrD-like helicase family protein
MSWRCAYLTFRHIKGLEFEAVFFVGTDRFAERLPDLFDRFFYVGVSRAATYLGVTCEGVLPNRLELVRGHFGTAHWRA